MNNTPKISVIIPVYNSEKYIDKCLNSVLQNINHNIEIICVNDGSNDKTETILEEYRKKNNNIKVINQSNSGVSKARNTGIMNSSGEYISFIDADDEIASHYFDILLSNIQKDNYKISVCEACLDGDYVASSNTKVDTSNHYIELTGVKNTVRCRLYTRDTIKNVLFPEELRFAEDVAFNLEIIAECKRNNTDFDFIQTDAQLYYYRQNQSSLTHNVKTDDWIPLCLWLLKKYKEESNAEAKEVYRQEAIKKLLSTRYETWIHRDNKNKKLLDRSLKGIVKGSIDFKYKVLVYFPTIYRLWRLRGDPSLINYERANRNK